MEKTKHGGDIYANKVNIDFSVNLNPLETPKSVKGALFSAVSKIDRYPDYFNAKTLEAISEMHGIESESIALGNGSSELFMSVLRAFNPGKVLLPIPSFYGYEYAACALDSEIEYFEMREAEGFALSKRIIDSINESDMLILGNPNNPTGKLIDKELLKNIAEACDEKGVILVLDECFMDFCEDGNSLINDYKKYKNLIIIRSFTKNFSVPGVRIGYLVCSDSLKVEKIKKQIPEWNISVFAQEAAIACSKEKEFLLETKDYVKNEREYLSREIENLGIKVFESDTNFLLIFSEKPLFDELLKKGILIRNCDNFKGLSIGFYRIAVKRKEDNEVLLEAIKTIV